MSLFDSRNRPYNPYRDPYPYRTRAKDPYNVGDGPVIVLCDRDKSYRVVRDRGLDTTNTDQRREKTIVSIPCDRTDYADNERGGTLAKLIADAINTAKAN
tara:strand:- start:875 stop:1174 length:300 start_codon:yes stop_codon:yes gene_type:complete